MDNNSFTDNNFLERLRKITEDNLKNSQFGVSELAREAGMSRSNLHRRIRKETKNSASRFIRQIRLERAMELLRQTSLTVSEVSWEVGFSSTSYFIKCFHEFFGYPPGEIKNHEDSINDNYEYQKPNLSGRKK